jgi:copper homeostasis protein
MIESKSRRVLLEVCIASVDDAKVAEAGGADRLELNAALGLGGLTPSLGALIEARRAVRLPLIPMIRPRPGGFCYSSADFDVMRRDLDLVLEHGADGFAFGVLHESGEVDLERCRILIGQAAGREAVFHRAFDVVPDPFRALEQLIDLGVRRVMTSGQEETAYQGAALISRLVERAARRIEILPAGGISKFTLADVLERTGCNQVHASLRGSRTDRSTSARPAVSFGGSFRPPEDRFDATDASKVSDLRGRLDLSEGLR